MPTFPKNVYGFIALTGGGQGALDAIDGANLEDQDYAFGPVAGTVHQYWLDADSGLAESPPDIIAPDTNAGDKRWILADVAGAAGMPSGVICMWHGTIANIPSDWYLCDGDNGTPNLIDRFILSVGAAEDPGGTGGSNTHTHAKGTLAADSGGSHGHSISGSTASGGSHGHSITGTTAAGSSHTHAGGTLSPHRGITQRINVGDTQGEHRIEVVTGGNQERIVLYAWYGATGGEAAHTHAKGTLAAASDGGHTHTKGTLVADSGGGHGHTISGTTASGDNVPVYYKLAFIMKS